MLEAKAYEYSFRGGSEPQAIHGGACDAPPAPRVSCIDGCCTLSDRR
jgi:hypothetical protein